MRKVRVQLRCDNYIHIHQILNNHMAINIICSYYLNVLLIFLLWLPLDAISKSDHVISGQIAVGHQYHFHLETHACLCVPEEEGYTVYSSTQWTANVQTAVAGVLGIPNNTLVDCPCWFLLPLHFSLLVLFLFLSLSLSLSQCWCDSETLWRWFWCQNFSFQFNSSCLCPWGLCNKEVNTCIQSVYRIFTDW